MPDYFRSIIIPFNIRKKKTTIILTDQKKVRYYCGYNYYILEISFAHVQIINYQLTLIKEI